MNNTNISSIADHLIIMFNLIAFAACVSIAIQVYIKYDWQDDGYKPNTALVQQKVNLAI